MSAIREARREQEEAPRRVIARGSEDLGGDQSPSHSPPKHTVCNCDCDSDSDCVFDCDCDSDFVCVIVRVVDSDTEVPWI